MEKKDHLNKIILTQVKQRSEASQKAENKAMEIDLERVLKQSDIIFTLNGFLLAIFIFIVSGDSLLNILFFTIAMFFMLWQSIKLREIRNKISITIKQYLIENAEIIKKNSYLLKPISQDIKKDIKHIKNIIDTNKKELDKITQNSINTTNKLIKRQEKQKYISLINFLIILIMIFIKYDIGKKIICNLYNKINCL